MNLNEEDLIKITNTIRPIDVRAEMFRKGDFSFIVEGYNEDKEWVKHEKQELVLKALTSGKYDEVLYGGAAGGSKAQPLDAKIYTPFGYKLMADIKVGDVIKGSNGKNTNVIAVHPQGKKKIYEIEFIDGAKTKCCGDHLWKVWYASKKSKQEKNSNKLGKIQTTEMLIKNLHRNPIIPLCEPLEFTLPTNRYSTNIWDKIDPYVLGCLIGDGGLTKQVSFTSIDEEIVELIKQRLPKKFTVNKLNAKYAYSITQNEKNDKGYGVNELYDLIRDLGLNTKSEHKKIPTKFYHSPISVRYELIRGLMDTDGTCDKRGHCSYSTSSYQLALDFQYIVRSLGYKATLTKNKTTHLDNYEIYIQGKNCNELFHLKRKKERCLPFNGGFSESGRRIISIKEVGYEEAQCITVDALDSLYITDDFIVTHNSWSGCCWILFMAICYPDTKYFIARNELKDILDSVLVTFNKVCKTYGFEDFKFNAVKNYIQFSNGSHINLIEVKYKPSDPMYEDLGSTEYTQGWIEEVGEINERAAIVLSSRVGRYNNSKYKIKGTVLYTCNPKNNWARQEFYDKHLNGTLEEDKFYLQCLVTENPFIEKDYIRKLEKIGSKDKSFYERLFRGNWDYEDNPNQLAEQEMIDKIYDNFHVKEGKTYLTVDAARYGADKAVLIAWKGWVAVEILTYDTSSTQEIVSAIQYLRNKYRISTTRSIGDDDGIGGGANDITNIGRFKNGARCIKVNNDLPNYRNLQVQCLYMLAERINEREIWINADISKEIKNKIKEELAQIVKIVNKRDESKLDLKPKGEIKSDIGRSPDYRDALMMRVYFDLKPIRRAMVSSKPRTLM